MNGANEPLRRPAGRAARARYAALVALLGLIPLLAPPGARATGRTSPPSLDDRLGADSLLARHVAGGLVDYAGLERRRADLDSALVRAASQAAGAIAASPAESRVAYYLNAYNLATLDLILRFRRERGARLKSIREIPGAWSRHRWTVGGKRRTLDEIEHQVLRREFREPRVHMALVCASLSCPALQPFSYSGDRLGVQLERVSREFVNDPTRNRFAPHEGRIRISKIFDWHGGDFVGIYRDSTLERLYGEKEGAVLAFASQYLPDETARALREARLKIEYLPYDWSLNSAAAAPVRR